MRFKITLTVLFLITISLNQNLYAQVFQHKDTTWLNIDGFNYFRIPDSTQTKEWCFQLEKQPNRQTAIDSLNNSLGLLENDLDLINFQIEDYKQLILNDTLDRSEYSNALDSLIKIRQFDSIVYNDFFSQRDSIVAIATRELQQDSLYCFRRVERKIQKAITYNDLRGINLRLSQANAELAEKKKLKTRDKWKKVNQLSVILSQNAFKNWNSGGSNAISTILRGHFERNYAFEFLKWDNDLRFGIGFNQEQDQPIKKSEDVFEYNSTFGYRTNLNSNWYYSGNIQFRTQFANGYNYPDTETPISGFMAPAYFVLGFGTSYTDEKNNLKLYLSPVTQKTTFVLIQELADEGAFGVTPAEKDEEGNIIKPGQTNLSEVGIMIQANWEQKIMKNIQMKQRLILYTDYINSFGNVDVDWDLQLEFLVNKYIKANFGTRIIYDDDIDTFETNEDGVSVNKGPKLQLKQLLGLGITYSF